MMTRTPLEIMFDGYETLGEMLDYLDQLLPNATDEEKKQIVLDRIGVERTRKLTAFAIERECNHRHLKIVP